MSDQLLQQKRLKHEHENVTGISERTEMDIQTEKTQAHSPRTPLFVRESDRAEGVRIKTCLDRIRIR